MYRFQVFNILLVLAAIFSTALGFVAPGRSLSPSAPIESQRAWGTTSARPSTSLSSSRDAPVMMPATLDREAVKIGKSGGPAVLDRPQTQRKSKSDEPRKEQISQGHEAWEVRIYNDGLNTREHVARSLVQVTGMSEMSAYQTMMRAHQNGIAVVGRYYFEVAEMYQEALQKQGIVCDIVPVEEEK